MPKRVLVYAGAMPMVMRPKPYELAPDPWPTMQSSDPVAEVARHFVINLAEAIGDRSIRSVSKAAGINHVSLQKILYGQVWPDLPTIARLEKSMNTVLWPGIGEGEFVPRTLPGEDWRKA